VKNQPPWDESGWPKLSETLEGPRAPNACQSCGRSTTSKLRVDASRLSRWLEHDVRDRVPGRPVVVVLCAGCAELLVESHPRLYRELENGEPFPGCMGICIDCKLRVGVACSSPVAELNGGPGLKFTWDTPPTHAHICRSPRRLSGFVTMYSSPVRTCSERKTLILEDAP
jgi:hypothetical protein